MVERLRILKILFLLTATNKQILNVQFQWVLATVYTVTTEQYSIENISVDEKSGCSSPPMTHSLFFKKKNLATFRSLWALSFPTRDRTLALCIGRQSFNHWTTREVPT